MEKPSSGRCLYCGEYFSFDPRHPKKTCSPSHRNALSRQRKKGVGGKGRPAVPGNAFSAAKRHPAFAEGNVVALKPYNDPEAIANTAASVREQLAIEYPGIDFLSLPTVELYCNARARALIINEAIDDYLSERKHRKVKDGGYITGFDAIPQSLWDLVNKTEANAAKLAQDLGLDLTGRAKAMKDAAITNSLSGPSGIQMIGAEGRKLRQLRGRG